MQLLLGILSQVCSGKQETQIQVNLATAHGDNFRGFHHLYLLDCQLQPTTAQYPESPKLQLNASHPALLSSKLMHLLQRPNSPAHKLYSSVLHSEPKFCDPYFKSLSFQHCSTSPIRMGGQHLQTKNIYAFSPPPK